MRAEYLERYVLRYMSMRVTRTVSINLRAGYAVIRACAIAFPIHYHIK